MATWPAPCGTAAAGPPTASLPAPQTREWRTNRPLPSDAPARVTEQIKGLVSAEPRQRVLAALALCQMGEAAAPAIPWLVDLLHDPYVEPIEPWGHLQSPLMPSHTAAEALVAIGEPAIKALLAALRDPDAHARESVAWNLGHAREARLSAALASALEDPESKVRAGAAFSLRGMAERKKVDPKAIAGAVKPLIGATKDMDWNVRYRAVEALSYIKCPEMVGVLIEALADANAGVRKAAARGLVGCAEPRAVEALIAALDDNYDEARKYARESLEWITKQKLGEDSATWRQWWAGVKTDWKPPAPQPTPPPIVSRLQYMIGAANSRYSPYRLWAIRDLGQEGPAAAEALGDLRFMLTEDPVDIRHAAAAAMKQIAPQADRLTAPLFDAVEKGDVEKVKGLLDQGALADATGPGGATPLIRAVQCKQQAVAWLLMKRGATIEAKDDSGHTALHYVADKEMIGTLRHFGAQISAQDRAIIDGVMHANDDGTVSEKTNQ